LGFSNALRTSSAIRTNVCAPGNALWLTSGFPPLEPIEHLLQRDLQALVRAR